METAGKEGQLLKGTIEKRRQEAGTKKRKNNGERTPLLRKRLEQPSNSRSHITSEIIKPGIRRD